MGVPSRDHLLLAIRDTIQDQPQAASSQRAAGSSQPPAGRRPARVSSERLWTRDPPVRVQQAPVSRPIVNFPIKVKFWEILGAEMRKPLMSI